jgi:hypothetical protein
MGIASKSSRCLQKSVEELDFIGFAAVPSLHRVWKYLQLKDLNGGAFFGAETRNAPRFGASKGTS